jgi:hypothetical protein
MVSIARPPTATVVAGVVIEKVELIMVFGIGRLRRGRSGRGSEGVRVGIVSGRSRHDSAHDIVRQQRSQLEIFATTGERQKQMGDKFENKKRESMLYETRGC